MAEVPIRREVSEEELRAFARRDAQRIFGRSVSEWDGFDYAFFNTARPYALDEALTVALETVHREGVGAVAVAAHIAGSDISRPGPDQDMEAAHQYAAVVDRIAAQ
jgi:hypothetical protein